jgi:hypothetical protein
MRRSLPPSQTSQATDHPHIMTRRRRHTALGMLTPIEYELRH